MKKHPQSLPDSRAQRHKRGRLGWWWLVPVVMGSLLAGFHGCGDLTKRFDDTGNVLRPAEPLIEKLPLSTRPDENELHWPPATGILCYLPFDRATSALCTWATADNIRAVPSRESGASPKTLPGIRGEANSFSGEGEAYELPPLSCLPKEGLTLSFWLKPEPGRGELFSCMGDSTPTSPNIGFRVEKYFGGIAWSLGDGKKTFRCSTPQLSLEAGCWTHVALTCDSKYMRVYLNGRESAKTEGPSFIAPHPRKIRIGSYFDGKSYAYRGLLDELLMLDHAQTPEDVFLSMVASSRMAGR